MHGACLVMSAGFKANLFAKDFKKQVLAADALKAWVQDCPDEVRACDPDCPKCFPQWGVMCLNSFVQSLPRTPGLRPGGPVQVPC